MNKADVLVVGAGMAGASAAHALAPHAKVVVLERESQPGYHTTGRSAALFTETYGPEPVRRLTAASRAAFDAMPAEGLTEHPVLGPRGVLTIGAADRLAALDAAAADWARLTPGIVRLPAAEALARVPALRPDAVAGAVWEPGAMDLDIHAIHHGYLRGLRRRGGELVCDAELLGLERRGGLWHAETRAGRFAAPVVVNAAGAWADAVGALAGAAPIGLVPKRRTALVFEPEGFPDSAAWPFVSDIDEGYYFKPEAGLIFASPGDATPVEPCDVQPEELDVALCIDRLERVLRHPIRRIRRRWAGLRSFVADGVPVAGFDAAAEGFFWLAGQGGYGIQTAPALAAATAGLILSGALPADLAARGLSAAALDPKRLR